MSLINKTSVVIAKCNESSSAVCVRWDWVQIPGYINSTVQLSIINTMRIQIPVTRRVKGYTRFVGNPVTRRVKGYTRFVGKYYRYS